MKFYELALRLLWEFIFPMVLNTCFPNHLTSTGCLPASYREQGRARMREPGAAAVLTPGASSWLSARWGHAMGLAWCWTRWPFRPCSGAPAAPWHALTDPALSFLFPTFQWLQEEEDVEWDVETSSRSEDKLSVE